MPNNLKLSFGEKPENKQEKVVKRDIYFYVCRVCKNKRRQTLKEKRADDRICAKCRRNQPDPNQIRLF